MRLTTLILTFLGVATQAQASWIELRQRAYPLPYCLFASEDQPTTFSVVLHPEGAPNIVGARLRISGLPTACSRTVTPSTSAASVTGDLFSEAGAEILFASAQVDPDVGLFDVTLTCPASVVYEVTLQTEAPVPVTPGFDCPLVIIDGTPGSGYACAGSSFICNSALCCKIGVEPSSWTLLKQLYK